VNDEGVMDASKQGYQHFFVLLGAASAVTTGHPQARKLLDDAIEVIEKLLERRGADVPGVLGRSLQPNGRLSRRQRQHARR
jgi:mannose/cellobiose epimerase-like protein (N-acyl-D-glucosamine 2-epimerase family)